MTNKLSDFVRNASSEEKKKVFNILMDKAAKDQLAEMIIADYWTHLRKVDKEAKSIHEYRSRVNE